MSVTDTETAASGTDTDPGTYSTDNHRGGSAVGLCRAEGVQA